MGGSDNRGSRRAMQFHTLGNDHSFTVDRNGDHLATCRCENRSPEMIPGFLYEYGISWVEEHARCNIQRLLRSGHDHDLT